MRFQRLARAEEIAPGQSKLIWAGKKPIVLANADGCIYALGGVCPHQKKLLEGAAVWKNLIECPWHHFQYDLRTGENHYPKNVYPADMPRLQEQVRNLPTYPVEIRDGEVWAAVDEE